MSRRKSFFHVRQPSLSRSLAARTSPARIARNLTGIRMPRNTAWITDPERFVYNKLYKRRTISIWRLLKVLIGGREDIPFAPARVRDDAEPVAESRARSGAEGAVATSLEGEREFFAAMQRQKPRK